MEQNEVLTYIPDFKYLRKRSGFTLRQVEEKTGISNSYLSQLENKKIEDPSFKTVITLWQFYNSNKAAEMEAWDKMNHEIEQAMQYWDEEKRTKVAKALEDLAKIIITV